MSTATPQADYAAPADEAPGLRARMLQALEPLFPPLQAPDTGERIAAWELAKAAGSYAAPAAEIGGLAGKRLLDFGCGWGGETVWLAQRAAYAVGCDIDRQSLEHGRTLQRTLGRKNLDFKLIVNERLPLDDDSIDAVFSTNVFEHVMDIDAALREIARVLRPGGSFVTRFGPLFYSPRGYHLCWATQVPYAHLLCGLGPIVEIARRKRPGAAITSWRQMGLNKLTFSAFRRAVARAGLAPRRLARIPVKNQHLLARLPAVGNLLSFGIDCHLAKPV